MGDKLISDKQYFTFFYSDTLYNAVNANDKIPLNFFKLDDNSKIEPTLGIWDFKVSNDFIYLIYMDMKKDTYMFLKKNRKTGETLAHKEIQNYKKPTFFRNPIIDPLNYDYVLWWENVNILHRQKM